MGVINKDKKLKIWKHLIYWIIPSAFNTLFIIMYFFGTGWMQSFVSPQLHHEYGALEMLSLIILLMAIIVAIKSFNRNDSWLLQAVRASCILIALFIFLEEQDFGMNYIDFLTNRAGQLPATPRTFHNSSYYMPITKNILNILITVFFGIMPFLSRHLSAAPAQIIPSKMMVTSLACLLIIPLIPFYLNYHFQIMGNKSLDNNISEFDESFLYYLLLVYALELNPRYRAWTKLKTFTA